MAEKKEKKYVSDNAQLMAEWNFAKNDILGYTPQTTSYGSAIKVWWECQNGHEWEASPNHRSRGRGCPECAKSQRAITKRKNIVAKRGSLADKNPELACEWHPTKNGSLTPYDISVNSSERVWWQCSKDKRHEWDAPINSRNSGVGCPVCSGHRLVLGINDLATVRPELAAQWHPTKNGELRPTDIIAGTDKSVWWQCEKGHEWQARIDNRINGNNCPICKGKKVLVGYNDLATVMPSIAKEWHPTKNENLTPQDVVAGSNKKVWWQCEKGHEWQTAISHRTLKGTRCPMCFGESKTSFPEQAIFFYFRQVTTAHNRYLIDSKTEIDIYLPEHKIGIEYDGAYFHKGDTAEKRERRKQEKLDKLEITLIRVRELEEQTGKYTIYTKPGANDVELTQTIKDIFALVSRIAQIEFEPDIDIARDKNKIYEQYIQSEKENSLAVVNPALAKEWHPTKNGALLPEFVSVHSNKKVWWQCEKGHEWEAVINSRKNGVGCPYCAGKRAIVGISDLATVNPDLAREWHPTKNESLTPLDVTAFSNRFVWWQCKEGHEWRAMIYDRSNGCGCPICSGHRVLVGYNDLLTVNPNLAAQWHPTKNGNLKASDVTIGSDKKVWWQCKEGHEWESVISSRNAGCGCPYCAGQRLLVGFNDLETKNPELAKEWHPTKNGDLLPSNVIAGTNKKAWWIGKCGHEWEASIQSRNSGRGCPYCASQKLLVGFNDLATKNPKLAKEWHPTKNGDKLPRDYMANSNAKVWWKCKNGHEWENAINTRNEGHGCPYCANQMVWVGYNDLATLNPELAAQWHPTKNGSKKPTDFTPGANKKVWWMCKNGHEWEAIISIRSKGSNCPFCMGKRAIVGYNDLATVNPDLAAQWHPTKNGELTPKDVMRGTNKKVWWLCSDGHEWQARIHDRNRGQGCPECAKQKRKKKDS